jgi:5S rRNA maturation endonuclease (ribonuclease M5)
MNSAKLADIASKFYGRPLSESSFQCRCPIHDDAKESLTLSMSTDGKLLVHCHAGCDKNEVFKRVTEDFREKDFRGGKMQSNVKRLDDIEAIYRYLRDDLSTICEVVRFAGKKFRPRHYDDGRMVWKKPTTDEAKGALYNWECRKTADFIVLCEGEKDCDNVNKLSHGIYLAVTNIGGASNFNKLHAEKLKDRKVIIVEDNDEAGRERTRKIVGMLRGHAKLSVVHFDDVKDISDWIDKENADWIKLKGLFESAEKIESKKESKQDDSDEATYEDFVELFREQLGTLDKDIFGGDLMYKDQDTGFWMPVDIREEEVIKSRCITINQTSCKKYKTYHVKSHLGFLERSLKGRLLVDNVEWDGADRISELCSAVTLDDSLGISHNTFRYHIFEWMRTLVIRLTEYKDVQPLVIVLVGHQGLGKDYWVDSLIGGLGQWAQPLQSEVNKDLYLQVCSCLCLKVSEFDKLIKTEPATLKDLITTPETCVRGSYERKAKLRVNRASWIGTCNTNTFLRDWTGNRRYAIFELSRIDWGYTVDRSQILAQAFELARNGLPDSVGSLEKAAKKEMKAYIDDATPSDPVEDFIEDWCEAAFAYVESLDDVNIKHELTRKGWLPNQPHGEKVIDQVCRKYGYKISYGQRLLARKKLKVRTNICRGYRFDLSKLPEVAENELTF